GKGREIKGDKRKLRELSWKEARLCVARDPRSVSGQYRATMGDVEQAGLQLVGCVAEAGGGLSTRVHMVADGANWILNQVEQHFGQRANFLVDFYHVSEYLSAAAALLDQKNNVIWLRQQQDRLKANRAIEVINELTKLESFENDKLARSGQKTQATKEDRP